MSVKQLSHEITVRLADHHRTAKARRDYARAVASAPTPASYQELMTLSVR